MLERTAADRSPTHFSGSAGPSPRATGIAMLIAASLLWSLSGVALKKIGMDAIGFASWRSLAAGIAMAALLPLSRGARPEAGWMTLAILLHAAVVTLLLVAMSRSTAAAGIILQYTGPAWCALLAWIFQRRAIERRTGAALLIAMGGVAIMLWGAPRGDPAGPVAGAISGVAFGGLILALERVNRRPDGRVVNPFLVVTLNNLGTAAIVLPVAWMWGTVAARPWQIAAVSATGVIQLGLPYLLFVLALRRVSPVEASLLILLEPVLNPLWVWLGVGERPDLPTFIGGGAILVALIMEATKNGKR